MEIFQKIVVQKFRKLRSVSAYLSLEIMGILSHAILAKKFVKVMVLLDVTKEFI